MIIAQKCLSRSYGKGNIVCVCNKEYCDTIGPVKKLDAGSFWQYTSNKAGFRLEKEMGKFTSNSDARNTITVRQDKSYQVIDGFGGAFTDATGINILSLSNDLQDKLMR